MRTLFYSWQSDLPGPTNRSFIQDCIERALKELGREDGVRILEADRDTQGTTGSPNITETIFAKIDKCTAFVADVSFINGALTNYDDASVRACMGSCTRMTPNPNVMTECGWALRSVGENRVILVLNAETGSIEDLPFDMRFRRVIQYKLARGQEKANARKGLVEDLKKAIRAILELPQTMLDLQFVDPETHVPFGKEVTLANTASALGMPFGEIPSYGHRRAGGTFDISDLANATLNLDYYREKAQYMVFRDMMRPVALCLENTGGRLLSNARFEAAVSATGEYLVKERHELPKLPEKRRDFPALRPLPIMEKLKSNQMRPGCVDIERRGEIHHLNVAFGNLQARAKQVSDVFYVGSVGAEDKLEIAGRLFADELSEPIPASLRVIFDTTHRTLSLDDLRTDLPEEKGKR